MKLLIQLIPLLFLGTFLAAQEICDNGIDDDGDNLVDLNDTEDCACFTDIPSSLIPNPSFEEMTCCPTGEGELFCAIGWSQASGPTTDYVHECGVLGNDFIGKVAPLPFPDGLGGIGFRDGKPGRPDFKEYAGACLNANMETGKLYRLDFFVGFPNDIASSVFDMSLYGTLDCNNLPFGGGQSDPGCPTNFAGWELIGRQTVSGQDEWKNVVFEFLADKPYEAIVLGPSCDPHPNFAQDPYFFFDRLLLAEREEFGLPFSDISGSVCADGLSISVDFEDALSYQWYLNGVALQGFTDQEIILTELAFPEGQYQVIIETEEGCLISQQYEMEIPSYEVFATEEICEGDSILFGQQVIFETDDYENLFIASDGCDSMVYLQVELLQHSVSAIIDTICEGDILFLDGFNFETEGEFEYQIPNFVGCDSLVNLDLTVIPANEGVTVLEEFVEINLGDLINISPIFVDPNLTSFVWQDDDGDIISQTPYIVDFQPAFSTELVIMASDKYGCPSRDTVSIRVKKNINTYIPNIFTPDDPNFNQNFAIYTTPAILQIAEIYIYDRWGELIFEDYNTGPLESYSGWDGRFNGERATEGVYVYLIKADLIDGTQEVYAGDITLVR